MVVPDSDLVNRLREIVRCSDLRTTTAAGVRHRLEAEFNVDLYGRRAFINEQIDIFLQDLQDNAAQDDEQEPEEEVDEDIQNDVSEKGQGKNESENQNESDRDEEISEEGEEEEENEEGEEEEEKEEKEEEESNDENNNRKKRSTEMDAEVKKKKGGFGKQCALSPQLQKILGVTKLARTEVVRKIWAYIREKNLQNPKDKRKIICDESLRELFRANSIGMFQMNKVLSRHIWPLDEPEAAPAKSRKVRQCRQDREVGPDEIKRKGKRRKGRGSGITASLPLSDALVKFFGTGEHELSRNDGVKRMWQYIKENELQDPSDKRKVLCDDKLKELFGVDSFYGVNVSRLLTPHFTRTPR